MGIFNWLRGLTTNTLYFPGRITKTSLTKEFENYKKLFSLVGLEYIVINSVSDSGFEFFSLGYKSRAKKIALKNLELFKKNNIKKIITNSPEDAYMFKRVYPELLNGWDIEVEFAIDILFHEFRKQGMFKKILTPMNRDKERVVFLDNHYLENYEIPREMISRLGVELIELNNNRKNFYCFPSDNSFRGNFPHLSEHLNDFSLSSIPQNVDKIISCSAFDVNYLKSQLTKTEEISEFILRRVNENQSV